MGVETLIYYLHCDSGLGSNNIDLKSSQKPIEPYTRSHCSSTSAEYNRSALNDQAVQENHVINWTDTSLIDREPDRSIRWIKKAIHVRKEGQRAVNCKEGIYQLSHAFDHFLGTTVTHTHITQPFYCSAGICLGLPGWAGTRKVKPGRVKPIWIYWSKR